MTKKEQLEGIARVLDLVDGYMGTQPQQTLLAFDGGLMTWAELREHVQYARKLPVLPKLEGGSNG